MALKVFGDLYDALLCGLMDGGQVCQGTPAAFALRAVNRSLQNQGKRALHIVDFHAPAFGDRMLDGL